MDMRLELIPVPVSDVDRARAFYVDKVGFNLDHDHTVSEDLRFVQLTPPGSACSIAIGTGVATTSPGSAQGMLLVVSDIDAAHAELAGRGVDISEVRDEGWGARHAYFQDPDGNSWQLQQPGS
jgi:catechol 2,3-dioxygenase-like lactoylglutathione lyase family enzyme